MNLYDAAALLAAAGTPFAVYLASAQLQVARFSSESGGLNIGGRPRHDFLNEDGESWQKFEFELTAAGPRGFHELWAYIVSPDGVQRIIGPIREFTSTDDPVKVEFRGLHGALSEHWFTIMWAVNSDRSEGLTDRGIRINLVTDETQYWQDRHSARLILWWDRFITKHFTAMASTRLIRPVGRWKTQPQEVNYKRSRPGWPGEKSTKLPNLR